MEYRDPGTVAVYWAAFVAFTGLGLLTLSVVVHDALSSSRPGAAGTIVSGVVVAALMPVLLAAYGRRRVYLVRIDGDDLVCRAPFKTQRVALDQLRIAEVRVGPGRHDRTVSVRTITDETVRLAIGRRIDLERFAMFCDSIAARVPSFDYTAVRAHAARGR